MSYCSVVVKDKSFFEYPKKAPESQRITNQVVSSRAISYVSKGFLIGDTLFSKGCPLNMSSRAAGEGYLDNNAVIPSASEESLGLLYIGSGIPRRGVYPELVEGLTRNDKKVKFSKNFPFLAEKRPNFQKNRENMLKKLKFWPKATDKYKHIMNYCVSYNGLKGLGSYGK